MDSATRALNEKLIDDGWERRSVLSEPRLSEAVHEYWELGFEIHLEPVRAGDPETGCDRCFESDDTAHIIYTRKL
jgi:hypothetical protein